MKIVISFLFLALCVFAPLCQPHAQESDLQGYVPPPLFAEPKAAPTKKLERELKMPRLSREVENPPVEPQRNTDEPLIRSRIFKQEETDTPKKAKPFYDNDIKKDAPKTAVKPVVKPKPAVTTQKPILIEDKPVEKNFVKPGPEPIDLLQKKEIPKLERPAVTKPVEKKLIEIEPILIQKKSTSEGVVKGPKTMPSNKKKAVEAEVTFEENDNVTANDSILQRVQDTKTEVDAKLETPAPDVAIDIKLPELEKMPDGARKVVINYAPATTELSERHKAILNQLIIPEMDKDINLRLLLMAYASPLEGVLASDRRIALSRALEVRQYLIDQTISSSRLDVKSMGSQMSKASENQQIDHIALYLLP